MQASDLHFLSTPFNSHSFFCPWDKRKQDSRHAQGCPAPAWDHSSPLTTTTAPKVRRSATLRTSHSCPAGDPLGTPVKEWGGSSEIGCPHNNRGGTQKIPLGGKWQVCFCWPFKLDAQPTTAIINCWGSFWHKNCYSLHHRWPISCLHVVVWGHVRIFFENHHTWHPKPI